MRLELDPRHSVNLVGRGWWGAEDAEDSTPLDLPVTWVRFTYEDMTEGGEKEIIDGLVDTQAKYMDQGYPDIPYNFIIDEKGTAYEGRGWKIQGERPQAFQSLDNKCLDICYVGDYGSADNNPAWEQIQAAMYLVVYGIKEKMISVKYTTIGWRDESVPIYDT